MSRRLAKFAAAFEKQWYAENKTAGFDVQELRLGGLLRRTDSCRRRLLDYASGKIDRIGTATEVMPHLLGTATACSALIDKL